MVKVISPILFKVADKKSFFLHQDRLKSYEDLSVHVWLRRKWNKILNNLDQEDPENEEGLCLERLFDAPDNIGLNMPKYHQKETQIAPED